MTIMMSDLPRDLVEEILSRVPMKSLRALRSTCQEWNELSKHRILCKREVSQEEFLAFTMKETRVCSMRVDLKGIENVDVEPYIEQISKFNQVEISQVIHCNGLLLLVIKDAYYNIRLMIWNPYLGQTKSIEPKHKHELLGAYAFGCDNNNNYKILKVLRDCKIYDLKSNSWRVLDINKFDWFIYVNKESVSLKGYTYFYCQGDQLGKTLGYLPPMEDYLISFDFTKERFGPRLPLPSTCHIPNTLALTSVKEEQLAILFNVWYSCGIEIWITTKIEFDAVSWSKFLSIDVTRFDETLSTSFFIDQEKKLAMFFFTLDYNNRIHNIAYIAGENGHLRVVDLGDSVISYPRLPVDLGDSEISYPRLPVCSYVPSLVQINQDEEPSTIEQKTRLRLLPSLFYSTLFVSFIFLFIYFVFF